MDPALAQALTPGEALSLRSTVGVLEGVFTPFFLACQGMGGSTNELVGCFLMNGNGTHLYRLDTATNTVEELDIVRH